jgi:hypothetical protein
MVTAPDSQSARELRQISDQLLVPDRGTIVKPLTLVAR